MLGISPSHHSSLVQVEHIPDAAALALLRRGVKLRDGMTAPAGARRVEEPTGVRTPTNAASPGRSPYSTPRNRVLA